MKHSPEHWPLLLHVVKMVTWSNAQIWLRSKVVGYRGKRKEKDLRYLPVPGLPKPGYHSGQCYSK